MEHKSEKGSVEQGCRIEYNTEKIIYYIPIFKKKNVEFSTEISIFNP